MPAPETDRQKVVSRLKQEGWLMEHGGAHDKFKHPQRKGRIVVPRHRTLSPGVARQIAKHAGWSE
jgi:predicted RNA binding protein YcfA (HicA-like mRNA interferase family)